MTRIHVRDTDALQRLTTLMYLIPIVGALPALWTLFRRSADRRELAVCRQSIILAFVWLVAYGSLNLGAEISGLPTMTGIRLLFLNSLVTSSYFIASLWLMMRWWQGKSIRLSGLSQVTYPGRDS